MLTIENTDSDLKVHALYYANDLLVRVRLFFQKLLQSRSTCTSNKRKLFGKRAYPLSIRVQTTINYILICFNPVWTSKKMFFLQSASSKRHCVTHLSSSSSSSSVYLRAAWFELFSLFRYFYNHLSNYTKTIIRLRLVNIGEYSPRLRLGEYSPIFTSPSANNC